MQAFSGSTHCRNWLFSHDELAQLRAKSRAFALKTLEQNAEASTPQCFACKNRMTTTNPVPSPSMAHSAASTSSAASSSDTMLISPESGRGSSSEPMEESPTSEGKRAYNVAIDRLLSLDEEELLKQYFLRLLVTLCAQPRVKRKEEDDKEGEEDLDEFQREEREMDIFWKRQAWRHEQLFRPVSADVRFSASAGERIGSTAALYFSRFYLSNSIMLYPPERIMVASLYLAAKTEEEDLPADRMSTLLARHLPAAQEKLRLELLSDSTTSSSCGDRQEYQNENQSRAGNDHGDGRGAPAGKGSGSGSGSGSGTTVSLSPTLPILQGADIRKAEELLLPGLNFQLRCYPAGAWVEQYTQSWYEVLQKQGQEGSTEEVELRDVMGALVETTDRQLRALLSTDAALLCTPATMAAAAMRAAAREVVPALLLPLSAHLEASIRAGAEAGARAGAGSSAGVGASLSAVEEVEVQVERRPRLPLAEVARIDTKLRALRQKQGWAGGDEGWSDDENAMMSARKKPKKVEEMSPW